MPIINGSDNFTSLTHFFVLFAAERKTFKPFNHHITNAPHQVHRNDKLLGKRARTSSMPGTGSDQSTQDDSPLKRLAVEAEDEQVVRKSAECGVIDGPRDNQLSPLPDPTVKCSPDEFLLQLVKAQYGVSLEAKKALALDSYFTEVTEEQLATYTTEVVTAVRTNNLGQLKKLKSDGQPLNCANRFGESILNLSCRRGFEEITEFLLDQPEIDVRIRDDYGRTPLHDACWHPTPQLKICKWILQREPSLFLIKDKRGFTAFQYARPEHWNVWRKFLFENREFLTGLTKPDILQMLSK